MTFGGTQAQLDPIVGVGSGRDTVTGVEPDGAIRIRGDTASFARVVLSPSLDHPRVTMYPGITAVAAALLALALWPAEVASQQTRASVETVIRKTAQASSIRGTAPSIDGHLDDAAWQDATAIRDFVQKSPIEGAAATERTEVILLFDDEALYVGARMHRADPRAIRATVTRRDADSDAEVLTLSFDTFYDRRTAYSFAISSGGVRKDYYHGQDSEESREFQFDPVWLARARVDSAGWTAEMRIPFSQLRFSAADEQVWGLEIKRAIPDKNEDLYWVLIPRSAAGFASQFGVLRGISGIRPSRRLELLPYTAGDLTLRANPDPGDPFDRKAAVRAGADLKMGLGPNLTLDATVNPDFGQVEADPSEVNLTAFETIFTERRPFFVEGSEVLVGQGLSFLGRPLYFYSRRIGAPPRGTATADYVKRPANTTILGATKVTGRLGSGLTLGALTSLTSREYARTYMTTGSQFGSVAVEPLTGFGAVRLQKEVGQQHSTLGWTLTNVRRSFGSAGGLNAVLPANAVAGGTDWRLRYEQGRYELTGFAGFSRVAGDTAAIRRLQRTSAHNFQRPDQDHVSLDPTRTSLSGYTASLRGDKNAGRWTVWGFQVSARSPGFEINDLGQMRRADAFDYSATWGFRDTQSGRRLRYWRLNHNARGSYNYGWVRLPTLITQTIDFTFLNFWRLALRTQLTPPALSDELTRGGPLMATPRIWNWQVTLANQAQARYSWTAVASYGKDQFGGWNSQATGSLTLRAAARWQAQISPTYSRAVDTRQYVMTAGGGSAATYGSRYIFAAIERSTLSAQLRINYALTPDFTLEGYAEPFAATGRFYDFGELSAPRTSQMRVYGTGGTTLTRQPDQSYRVTDGAGTFTIASPDFNRLSFRSNVVLRWEWARGSTLFLIWQQNRQALFPVGDLVRPGSLWDATTAAGDNFIAVKATYWLSLR